ncbi:serine/threonine-protein kinase [Sulfurimonas sp.]|uniref:serine/threonine-protein kinase n=1 Tax=Sulfurimonas sp. TaxID=2022749 RepID=UPI0026393D79|nr:serine/threonine-protein kinase [Sulfurimonas sp.]MCW9067989.1 serine/threonine protein kinase [Sulfurimonas sp.]
MIDNSCLEEIGLSECQKLKEAGQKVVYKANSKEFGTVIVKVMKPNQDLRRVLREIDIVKNIEELNTSKIFKNDSLTCNGVDYLYVIEEFISGENLKDYISRVGTIDFDEVCKFLNTMLDELVILEKNNFVHRDIKPDNIMRDEEGNFILIDYGIARDLSGTSYTDTESATGPATIAYAPMEQIDNEKENISSQVDLYSLSLVAYEMISGINPFSDGCSTISQVIRKIDKGNFEFLKNEHFNEMLEFIHTNMNRYRTKRAESASYAREWFDDIYTNLCRE